VRYYISNYSVSNGYSYATGFCKIITTSLLFVRDSGMCEQLIFIVEIFTKPQLVLQKSHSLSRTVFLCGVM